MNAKQIIGYIITGIICLIIGAGSCFIGIYLYPSIGLRDIMQLNKTTNDQLEQSRRAIEDITKQLTDANGIISQFEKSTQSNLITVKNLDGTVQRSQDINNAVGKILSKYVDEK